MCLGVPGRLVSAEGEGIERSGVVDFGGTEQSVSLAYVPDANPGDWVIVHVGFALSRLDEEEAQETRALLDELAASAPEPIT